MRTAQSGLKDFSWLRPLAFAACAVCLVSLAAFVVSLTSAMQDRLVEQAVDDLDLFVRAVSQDLREKIKTDAQKPFGAPLNQLVPQGALARGRRILVTDERGRVAAAFPPIPSKDLTLSQAIGAEDALVDFADNAGVLRVTLPDGVPALVSVRKLPTPFGQVAMIYPVDNVLGEWRVIASRYALLFACTTLLLLVIVLAYFRQSRRRQDVERANTLIRRRLEAALSRGRCGLWEWDIARGRIYWSDSMYEMLGLPAERRSLSYTELSALLHPDDGDFQTMADMVASARTNSVDHEFRLKNAAGEWIWLRARAQIVEDGREAGKHLDWNRHRRFGATRARRTNGDGQFAPARRDRRHFRSLRAVGRQEPPRDLQFEISLAAWAFAGSRIRRSELSADHELRHRAA